MASIDNRLRRKWQDYAVHKADDAEVSFYDVLNVLFEGTTLKLVRKPDKFRKVYLSQQLDQAELNEIYIPDTDINTHGFVPDALIRNEETGKEIYVEVKRQDGWVEGKKRYDGRGNAHERFCKYFTPGLLAKMRAESGIQAPAYPFWIVFQGDITRDICHVKEIRYWFAGINDNVTFWRDSRNPAPLVEHFLNYILPLIS